MYPVVVQSCSYLASYLSELDFLNNLEACRETHTKSETQEKEREMPNVMNYYDLEACSENVGNVRYLEIHPSTRATLGVVEVLLAAFRHHVHKTHDMAKKMKDLWGSSNICSS